MTLQHALGAPSATSPVFESYKLASLAAAQAGGHSIFDLRQFSKITARARAINTAGTNPTLDVHVDYADPAFEYDNARGLATPAESVGLRTAADAGLVVAMHKTTAATKPISITKVQLRLKRNGTIAATKKLVVSIATDNSDEPAAAVDGAGLADGDYGNSAQIEAADIGTDWETVEFTFATPVNIPKNTKYWICLVGDYTASATNYISVGMTATEAAEGRQAVFDGTSWTDDTDDDMWAVVTAYEWEAKAAALTFIQITTANDDAVHEITFNRRDYKTHFRFFSAIGGTSSPAFDTNLVFQCGGAHNNYPARSSYDSLAV